MYYWPDILLDRQIQKTKVTFKIVAGSLQDLICLITVPDFHGTAAFIEHIAVDLTRSGDATTLDAKTYMQC